MMQLGLLFAVIIAVCLAAAFDNSMRRRPEKVSDLDMDLFRRRNLRDLELARQAEAERREAAKTGAYSPTHRFQAPARCPANQPARPA